MSTITDWTFFFGRYSGVFTGYFIFTAGLQLISFIIV